MTFRALTPILLVASMATIPRSAFAQESPSRCLELQLGRWLPPLSLGADTVFLRPPARVRLETELGTAGFERGRRLIRPAPGVTASIHRFSYWASNDSALALTWSTGFSGLRMILASPTTPPRGVAGDTLRGVAESFWDFDRLRQTAPVVAIAVSCSGATNPPTDSDQGKARWRNGEHRVHVLAARPALGVHFGRTLHS